MNKRPLLESIKSARESKGITKSEWTGEKPTEPGYYLWVEKGYSVLFAEMCLIEDSDSGLQVQFNSFEYCQLSQCANRFWLKIPDIAG